MLFSLEYTSMIRKVFSGIGCEPSNGFLADIYIVLLDRLPMVEELHSSAWDNLGQQWDYETCLRLVDELTSSEEFKGVANRPEEASWRVSRALLGVASD